MRLLNQILLTRNLHGNAKKVWMIYFFVQGILNFLQEIYSKWNVFYQSTFVSFGWAWQSCYPKNNKTCMRVWVRHDYITIS
jgi:hypothetical protein